MSDAWYYAEDGAAKGPMPFGSLVSVLSAMHDPADVLVWRAGFQAWTRAADVAELATRLGAFPPGAALPAGAQPQAGSEPKPLRIGGWLILLAIGQVLAVIQMLVAIGLAIYLAHLQWKLTGSLPPALIAQALVSAALFILVATATVLFFRKSRRYPRFFVYETIASAVGLALAPVWLAVTTGQSFNDALGRVFDAKDIVLMVLTGFLSFVFIAYLYISKRARMTFIR